MEKPAREVEQNHWEVGRRRGINGVWYGDALVPCGVAHIHRRSIEEKRPVTLRGLTDGWVTSRVAAHDVKEPEARSSLGHRAGGPNALLKACIRRQNSRCSELISKLSRKNGPRRQRINGKSARTNFVMVRRVSGAETGELEEPGIGLGPPN